MSRLGFIKNRFSRRQDNGESIPEVDIRTRERIIRLFALMYNTGGMLGHSELRDRCAYLHQKMLLTYGSQDLIIPENGLTEDRLLSYMLTCETRKFLDWLELITEVEDHSIYYGQQPLWNDHRIFSLAEDINEALELGGCQYRLTEFQFTGFQVPSDNPRIIRADEPLILRQAITPALNALRETNNSKASQSLMNALQHQRQAEYSDAAREAGNALESTCRELYKKLTNQDAKTADGNIANIIPLLLRAYEIPTSLTQPIQQIANIRNTHSNAHPVDECSEELAGYAIATCCSAIALLARAAKKRNLI